MPPPPPDPGAGTRSELGAALRALRRAARLTGERAAARAALSQSKLSRIENGRALPTAADVTQLLAIYRPDPQDAARIAALARAANQQYRSARADAQRGVDRKQAELAGLERTARVMRHFLPAVPTGLLHTRAYAEATLAALGTVPPGVFDQVINAKMARQEVLKDASRRFVFLLTETAIRARVVPLDVMAEQCAHLADLAGRANLEIALLPFAAPWPVMALNVFVIYDERFVTLEVFSGEVVLDDRQDVEHHLQLFETFLGQAMTGPDTAAFLRAAAAEYAAMAKH